VTATAAIDGSQLVAQGDVIHDRGGAETGAGSFIGRLPIVAAAEQRGRRDDLTWPDAQRRNEGGGQWVSNADNPEGTRRGRRECGAEGIGLCRTGQDGEPCFLRPRSGCAR